MSDIMNNTAPEEGAVPAFASVPAEEKAPASTNEPAFTPSKTEEAAPVKYVEPENVFAQGLPEWSLEPPQVVVRRK